MSSTMSSTIPSLAELSTVSLPQLAGISVILALLPFLLKGLTNPLRHIPGPWYSRWTGLVYAYYHMTGKSPTYIHALHQKYGPVLRIAPNSVDFTNPDDAQAIHRIKGDFIKGDFYKDTRANLFNVQDVEVHRRWRKLLSYPLSESGLQTVLPQVEANVRFAIQQMAKEMETRGAADVFKWWMLMTSDVIGELTFGESFRLLQTGQTNQYLLDIQTFGASTIIEQTLPWVRKIPKAICPSFLQNALEAVPRVNAHSEKLLSKYQQRLENDAQAPPTLFTRLINNAKGEDTLSHAEITYNAGLYVIAGSDTTSNTLTYLVYRVCKDPAVKQRLVEEVSSLPGDFDTQQLKDLPYLSQVVSETLRLHSAAPAGLPRLVPPSGATLGGYTFPPRTTVLTQAYSLHRNEDIFPEPDRFNPDRWAHPTKRMKDSYMPFGGGSRSCIGIHLAYHELRLATTLFFRQFPHATISKLEGMSDEDMEPALYFIMNPKGHRCLVQAS
ncbi:cytochrome P450 [Whalleya microplaca]|nr:cytochrome P450 [Whalleya microplaca]